MWGSSKGLVFNVTSGFSSPLPCRGRGEMEVGESMEAKMTGNSEIKEAKEGPSRERNTCWAWKLPESSSLLSLQGGAKEEAAEIDAGSSVPAQMPRCTDA